MSCFNIFLIEKEILTYLRDFCSISGPSATVYALVGEFHSVEMRSRVMMYSKLFWYIVGIFLHLQFFLSLICPCMRMLLVPSDSERDPESRMDVLH